MPLEKQVRNYGLILEELKEEDYLYGADNGIPKVELWPDLNLYSSLPSKEKQYNSNIDTFGCVSFSALNCFEMVMDRKIELKQISTGNMEWLEKKGYLDENGKFNCSDRFTAKMSGTTKQGNYRSKVLDSIRHHGVVPEKTWPFPTEATWEIYYAEIPDEVKKLGEEFMKRFEFNYEMIVKREDMSSALRYSPVQVFVHAWESPVDGVYQRTNNTLNHAVLYFEDTVRIFDHYPGADQTFIKTLSKDFNFGTGSAVFTITELFGAEELEGANIKGSGAEIYHVSKGKKRIFPDEATMWSHGFSTNDFIQVSSKQLLNIPTGEPMDFMAGLNTKVLRQVFFELAAGNANKFFKKYFNS